MRFNFTASLVLGFTVVMIGGCSCGPRHRLPFLAKMHDGMIRRNCTCENVSTTISSTDTAIDSPCIVNEPSYTDQPAPPDAETDFREVEAPPEPRQAPLELPEVPKPPSQEPKEGGALPELPELKRADLPDEGKSGSYLQPRVQPLRTIAAAPVVEEIDESLGRISEDESEIPTLKALPISTKRTSTPAHASDDNEPANSDDDHEATEQIHLERLPAKSFRTTAPGPVVLRASPVENHHVANRDSANARATARFGLPKPTTVPFKNIPALEEEEMITGQVDFSDSDTPFEEPPANSRIPDVEPVPRAQSHPPIQVESDRLAKPTSFQVPMENDASVLLEIASSIDCGLVDSDLDCNPNQPGQKPVVTRSNSNTQHSIVRIVEPQPLLEEFQILRLRASTPVDGQAPVPPKVRIRSMIDPVIVRGTHPDAILPIVHGGSAITRIQAHPTSDQDRLEASIRRLSSGAKSNPSSSKTIDR